MVIKLIKVRLRPGCKDEFFVRQRVWNDGMFRQPGFLGVHVATVPSEPDLVFVVVLIESRSDLDRFMSSDHDTLAASTKMAELYSEISVDVLDVVDPAPPEVRFDLIASRAGSGHQISVLSESYRVSCVLRTAVASGLFDMIGEHGTTIAGLAVGWQVSQEHVARLVAVLASLNLLSLRDGVVRLKPIASRHLLRGRDGYLGHLVLHNTRPALWQRWSNLRESLALPDASEGDGDQVQFLRAMSDIASASQASALISATDLRGRQHLLDIGGGLGDYAVALCRAYPSLTAVVLDLPDSTEPVRCNLEQQALEGRIAFVGGDYRSGLPGGNYDVVLLSNILRGETVSDARALIDRIHAALAPGGLLLVQDSFIDERPGWGPLLPALFGLHLPDGMNGSVGGVSALMASVGFRIVEVRCLDGFVVANKLIVAEKR